MTIRIAVLVATILAPLPGLAADRAQDDCLRARSADRMIAGCSQVIARGAAGRDRAIALSQRAGAYAALRDAGRAIADYDEAVRVDPGYATLFFNRGNLLAGLGDRDRAIADYDEAIRLDPNYSGAYNNRGVQRREKNEVEAALEDFAAAERTDPRNVNAFVNRATTLYRRGDKPGALAALESGLAASPRQRELTGLRRMLLAEGVAAGPGSGAAGQPDRAGRDRPPPGGDTALPRDLNALHARIVELHKAGQYEPGLRAAETYEARIKAAAGPSSPRYAVALGLKGYMLQGLERLPDAAAAYEAAVGVAESLDPRGDVTLELKTNLAQIYVSLARFDEAERLQRAILASREAALGPDHVGLLLVLSGLTDLSLGRGRFAEAEAFARRIVAIRETANGPAGPDTLEAVGKLAGIHLRQQRADEAEALYGRVRAAGNASQDREVLEAVGRTLGNLAILQREVGRYAEAERSGLQSLAAFEKAAGPRTRNVAQALSNLATLYSVRRRDREAEGLLNRALVIQEQVLGPESEPIAYTLGTLGGVLLRERRPGDAEPILRRSLLIFEKTLGPQHPRTAFAIGNLAVSLAASSRAPEATELTRKALAILEKAYGPTAPELAAGLNNLGDWARLAGDDNAAAAYLDRALASARSGSSPDPQRISEILLKQARLAAARHRGAEVEARLTEGLALLDATFGPDHPNATEFLDGLAGAAGRRGDWAGSLTLRRRAASIAIRVATVGAELAPTADDAARRVAVTARALAEADWRAAEEDPAVRTSLAHEAFTAAQRAQLSSAATALAQMAARFGAGDGAVSALAREQQDLSARIQALDRTLTAALGGPAGGRSDAVLGGLRAQIAELRAKLSDVTGRIGKSFPSYADLVAPSPLAIGDVQRLLRPDEALVSWLVAPEESFVFAVTREGTEWQRIGLGSAALDAAVARLRATLDLDKLQAAPVGAPDRLFDLKAAHDLYRQMLGPVEHLVAAKRSLIVVPAGALTSLPPQLLPTAAPAGDAPTTIADAAYRDAAWLVRRHAVTVLPSVAALKALRSVAKASGARKALIGFADPVFQREANGSAARQVATRGGELRAYRDYFRGGQVDLDALRRGLPALPETADEVRRVARELGAPAADLRLGEAATVTAAKSLPLDQYRIVYFATHGLVAGDVAGLTEPALALSIPAAPSETDMGLLLASDVTQLKLDADWVVLSACNTAVGDTPGAEALSGLARAFFYAGARALLVSHWPVRSDAAVDLTTHSFADLVADRTLGRAEALRRAMLALIDRGQDLAYPAVWAPFVLVGEGAP